VRVTATILLLFILSIAAHAQLPSGNVFIGYSYARADLSFADHASLRGWDASLEGKLFPMVGMVAEMSSHYNYSSIPLCTIPGVCPAVAVNSVLRTYAAGPQVSLPFGKFSPFAHALFGAAHIKEGGDGFAVADTSFAAILGGGLDYHLFYRIKWRVQADEVQTRFFDSTQNNLRVSTGVVVHF